MALVLATVRGGSASRGISGAGAGRRQLKLLFLSRLMSEVWEARKNFRCCWIVRSRGDMLETAVLLFDTGPDRAPDLIRGNRNGQELTVPGLIANVNPGHRKRALVGIFHQHRTAGKPVRRVATVIQQLAFFRATDETTLAIRRHPVRRAPRIACRHQIQYRGRADVMRDR